MSVAFSRDSSRVCSSSSWFASLAHLQGSENAVHNDDEGQRHQDGGEGRSIGYDGDRLHPRDDKKVHVGHLLVRIEAHRKKLRQEVVLRKF